MQSPHTPKAHLRIVSHDVVESGQQTQAGGNLWVHGTVDIVEQVERLADEFVAFPQQPLLDLALATGEKVERVCCLSGGKKTHLGHQHYSVHPFYKALCAVHFNWVRCFSSSKGKKKALCATGMHACKELTAPEKLLPRQDSVRMSLMPVISLAQQCNLVKTSFFLGT